MINIKTNKLNFIQNLKKTGLRFLDNFNLF